MLTSLLGRLKLNKASTQMYAGVQWSAQQLKVALLHYQPDQSWRIVQMLQIPVQGPQQLASAFVQLAEKLPAGCRCTLIIPPDRYIALQVDKPPVPDAELMSALPWTVKDLVSLPDGDLVLDYMDVPLANPLQIAKLNVVVSSKSWLQEFVRLFHQHGLILDNIQPEEWLARNLTPQRSYPVMLVCHQPGQDLSVLIVQDKKLLFSRRLRGFARLDQISIDELQQGVFDNLLLELQRSIDFFEGQLKQAPVREIALWLSGSNQLGIVQLFKQNGFGQVFVLDSAELKLQLAAEQFQLYGCAIAGAVEPMMQRLEVQTEVAP